MPLQFNQFVLALMAGGGGAALPALSSFALVGDSLTQYGFFTVALNAVTLTRDASGVVTFTKTAHGLSGSTNPVYLVNCTDASYDGEYIATAVDANNLSLTGGLAGAAGTTVTAGLGAISQTNRIGRRGLFPWFNSSTGGGLRLVGEYGQGADGAAHMDAATALALSKNPDAIVLAAGINDCYALNLSAATAWANIKARIDQINAGGNTAVCCAITPVLKAYSSYSAGKFANSLQVNSDLQAYCDASPSNRVFVDTFTPLYEIAADQAYSWATTDGIHWSTSAAKLVGEAVNAALSSRTSTSPTLLPENSGDTGAVGLLSKVVVKGPWASTSGGALGASLTGSAPVGTAWNKGGAQLGSGVCSIIDPGDSKGYFAACDYTSTGANSDIIYYPWGNANQPLASLGISTTDTIILACEFEWSNAILSKLGRVELALDSRTSALPNNINSWACDGVDIENVAGRFPDAGTQVLLTGPLKLDPAVAFVAMRITARFFAASASALTLKVRRVCLYKL